MLVGLVDVYANHGILAIGGQLDIDTDIAPKDGVGVSSSHVLVTTRGQLGLVRARLWNGIGPRIGTEVVATTLDLSDQYLFIFDIEKIGTHSFATGRLGTIPIRVSVDDPGFASRVDILIGEGGEDRELTSVAGHPLGSVTVTSGMEMEAGDELGLILSSYDLPLSRLAAAIKLIVVSPAARPAIVDARIDQVAEWSRWLTPWQPLDRSRKLGSFLLSELPRLRESMDDAEMLKLAERVLQKFVR